MLRSSRGLVLAAVLISYAAAADAQGAMSVAAEVGHELRFFPRTARFDGQLERFQPSLFAEVELSLATGDRRQQLKVTPFLRLDGEDSERTHTDLREAYWRYNGSGWDLLVGARRVFWGVAESRHLVNIINQVDAVEDLDEEDFLGQPLLNLGLQRDFGRFDLFVMTGFRERTFPGVAGRLRFALPVDADDARIERDGGHWAPDVALRYSHFIGDVDLGLHLFSGTGREPFLEIAPDGDSFVPVYEPITQGGIDLQYTRGRTLWKLEAIGRAGRASTFGAVVGGFEHTVFQALGSADLGILLEVLHDGRDPQLEPPTALENDVFVGGRLTINDTADTALLLGAFVDYENGSMAVRAEYETRVRRAFRLEVEAQWFATASEEDFSSVFRRDSSITLRIARFF